MVKSEVEKERNLSTGWTSLSREHKLAYQNMQLGVTAQVSYEKSLYIHIPCCHPMKCRMFERVFLEEVFNMKTHNNTTHSVTQGGVMFVVWALILLTSEPKELYWEWAPSTRDKKKENTTRRVPNLNPSWSLFWSSVPTNSTLSALLINVFPDVSGPNQITVAINHCKVEK